MRHKGVTDQMIAKVSDCGSVGRRAVGAGSTNKDAVEVTHGALDQLGCGCRRVSDRRAHRQQLVHGQRSLPVSRRGVRALPRAERDRRVKEGLLVVRGVQKKVRLLPLVHDEVKAVAPVGAQRVLGEQCRVLGERVGEEEEAGTCRCRSAANLLGPPSKESPALDEARRVLTKGGKVRGASPVTPHGTKAAVEVISERAIVALAAVVDSTGRLTLSHARSKDLPCHRVKVRVQWKVARRRHTAKHRIAIAVGLTRRRSTTSFRCWLTGARAHNVGTAVHRAASLACSIGNPHFATFLADCHSLNCYRGDECWMNEISHLIPARWWFGEGCRGWVRR
mmetsp:Transcript_13296/g.41900  ORF Transcript_13296/g.41900 Transcript_13296/m.41900 type:complete len:336 (-) Transcript_13296:168-1175(-)